MQQILQLERSKSNVPSSALASVLYGHQYSLQLKRFFQAAPVLEYTHNLFNKSRLQIIKDSYRYFPIAQNYNTHHSQGIHPHLIASYEILLPPSALPGFAHSVMFIKYIQLMGTERHKQLYLDKSISREIVGCYAQTQLGHGSDIRSLQTTAELDLVTQEWILDSPTVSSAKYWPGQLSFLANYAVVFAQMLIAGKNYGVHPFLVQIKDDNYNWLPGIQGGDIGPKIGFHSKQNGYMYLRSIRIPRENLFTKYVEVSPTGEYKTVGDPRIGYGTMMSVRELISCAMTVGYATPIIIGGRYSFFSKQFKNEKNQENAIINYQTQQNKIIPRIAEYYAIRIAGNKIREVSQENLRRVEKKDFSLLQQTHSNLAFSKCLFSELIQDGAEIIRRSLGGHGTSYYSGVPQIMNEYASNNTHEGQNTVMYLQTARYILKNYLKHLKSDNSLHQSVEYMTHFNDLANVNFAGKQQWKTLELKDALVKSIHYLLGVITARIANKKDGETEIQVINKYVGIRLQQLAQLHAVHFMINEQIKAIDNQTREDVKGLLTDLCQLFAITQMQRLAQPIIEGGFICPLKWSKLNIQKEAILKKLRPHIAVLLDSFYIPEKLIRSELARGNPYENFLNRARQCEINTAVSEAARSVGRIGTILAAKPRL